MNATQRDREIDTAMTRSWMVRYSCACHLRRSLTGRGASTRQNGGLDVGFKEREVAVRAGEAAVA
jgi:hypothetical protein